MEAMKQHHLLYQILILEVFFSVGRFACLDLPELCPEVCCCSRARTHGRLSGEIEGFKVDCSRKNLTSVPEGLSNVTSELNLSYNKLTDLPAGAFSHLSSLKELILIGNGIETLNPNVLSGLEELTILKLQMNSLKEVPQIFHQGLTDLHYISLDDNKIETVPAESFQHIPSLRILTLDGNLLSSIPMEALSVCPKLQRLRLGSNRITDVPEHAFQNNSHLTNLILSRNSIGVLNEGAFSGLFELAELAISGNPLMSIAGRVFANLPSLDELMLSSVKSLEEFPDLEGTHNLDKIILDRCSISVIPDDLCLKMPHLRKLDLHSNAITTIPNLTECSKLSNLHLGVNKITTLEGRSLQGLSAILDLTLKSNYITSIPADAFIGLTQLEYLDLSDNMIEDIHEDAFIHFHQLQNLNLAHNKFPILPSKGLSNLVLLQTAHNEHLHEIPSPDEMPVIERIVTAYPYHCCQYVGGVIGGRKPVANSEVTEEHIWMQGSQIDWSFSTGMHSADYNNTDFDSAVMRSIFDNPSEINFPLMSEVFHSQSLSLSDYGDMVFFTVPPPTKNISCIPQPDAFMPCSDLFGSWFLRVGVWFVFLLALIGNGIVILVIVFSRTKVDVSRFLICNLACADFAMGIYLGFLAGVDASTLGVFRKYGVDWQLSEGCGTASFLAIFSSELSIYTLCVITLERFYAIKHALHLEKRLKLKHAMVIMCFGWIFSLVVASMPLLGVNSYYRYPVCLPFDISTKGALAYVSGLMLLNSMAFIVIMVCYISIYCAIQGSHAWNCNDSRVARRMSLLVFTDFACWAPIAFFGLTSAFKLDLISLHGAKVLTVFVLPVNSCANPFLYTILTKQFKKDCRVILQWFNTKTCTSRRNSRSVTLSLARQASLRSTMAHQISQNRWRASGSGSQEVGVMDPSLFTQRKQSDLMLVTEKPSSVQEKSSSVSEKHSSREPSHITSDWTTTINGHGPSQNGRSVMEQSVYLSPTDPDTIRRGSTSPLLDRSGNKEKVLSQVNEKKKKRKFSMPLWVQKKMTARNTEQDVQPENESSTHKQCRSFSFSEGFFGRKSTTPGDEERKASSEPNSSPNVNGNKQLSTKANNNRASKECDTSSDSPKKCAIERCERWSPCSPKRSPCSPKHLWRQRSPVSLRKSVDASEMQGLLDRRESLSDGLASDKITTVSLEVTNQNQQETQPSRNSVVQRPDNLNLTWKSADTLDSGNCTGSPSNSEKHHFPTSCDVSGDSTPITVTPTVSPIHDSSTSISSPGPYPPKILITRLDSFSNVLPSPTETVRRLDKSRESVV